MMRYPVPILSWTIPWAVFKSNYEHGDRFRQDFEKRPLEIPDCILRVCGLKSGVLSILNFSVHNMAIWSVPREPQRNSTHVKTYFCPKRSYQVHFAKIFHFGRRRRRRRLKTTCSLARCLPLTHPGVKISRSGIPLTPISRLRELL